MLQEQSRDAVPQELSALIELQQGMQTGKVAPTTPQGQPTVAAQMAGAAQQQMAPQMAPQMPMGSPAVNQVARQAGIAGQIQAMRQQQMQQAMMQQAAQATQRPPMMAAGGVASLNPRIKGFAPGGIVGYAGDDESYAIEPGDGYYAEPRTAEEMRGRDPMEILRRAAQFASRNVQRDPETGEVIPRRTEQPAVVTEAERQEDMRRLVARSQERQAELVGTKIPPEVQAARDRDRLAILQAELADAQRRAAQGDPRAQGDIESLRKEIQRATTGTSGAPTPRPAPLATSGEAAQPMPAAEAASSNQLMALINSAMGNIEEMKKAQQFVPQVAKPEEGIPLTLERIRVRNELARQLGLDPDMLTKQAQQTEEYYKRGEEKLAQRQAELEARAPTEGRIRTLLGMRGRRFSDVVAAGAERGMAYDEAVRNQVARFEDLKMQMEGLRIDKVNTLKQLKYATDMGEYDKAMQYRQKLLDIDAAEKKAAGDAAKASAQMQTQLAQVIGQTIQKPGELERVMAEYQRLKATDPEAARQYLEDIGVIRGAGRPPSGERLQLDQLKALQKTYTEQAENMLLPKEQREQAAKMLKQVNDQIAKLSKLDTGAASAPMYAVNPKTGERIMSTDGGQTWSPVTPAR